MSMGFSGYIGHVIAFLSPLSDWSSWPSVELGASHYLIAVLKRQKVAQKAQDFARAEQVNWLAAILSWGLFAMANIQPDQSALVVGACARLRQWWRLSWARNVSIKLTGRFNELKLDWWTGQHYEDDNDESLRLVSEQGRRITQLQWLAGFPAGCLAGKWSWVFISTTLQTNMGEIQLEEMGTNLTCFWSLHRLSFHLKFAPPATLALVSFIIAHLCFLLAAN